MSVDYEKNDQHPVEDSPVYGPDGNILWFSRIGYEAYLARTNETEDPVLESIPKDPNAGITKPEDLHKLRAVSTEFVDPSPSISSFGLPLPQSVDGVIQHNLRIIDVPEVRNAEVIHISPAVYLVPKPETKRFDGLITAKRVAIGGLSRFIKFSKSASHDALELAKKPFDVAENLSHSANMRAGKVLMSGMARIESLSKPELKKPGKKPTLALIGTAALIGVGYFASSRGLSHNLGGSGHAQEAASNLAPKQISVHHEVVQHAPSFKLPEINPTLSRLTSKLTPVTAHAARAVKKAYEIKNTINIKTGDGYTQAIANRFPNHSAIAYAQSYKEAIKQFGPNFIKGIAHYQMKDGNWGLSGSGKAQISQKAINLFSSYFKTHR